MNWKRQAAAFAAAAAAGSLFTLWATFKLADPPEVVNRPPEVGRPTDLAADWQKERIAGLELEVARLTAEQARRTAEKYGEALGATVQRARMFSQGEQSRGVNKTAPASGTNSASSAKSAAVDFGWSEALPSVPDISEALLSGELLPLTERRFGPGPRGDEIDVLAVIGSAGGPVELVGKWADYQRPAAPFWAVEKRRFLEVGPAYTESGPGAIVVLGWDGLRVRRVTFGLRAGAVLSGDPAAFVAATGRWEFGG